ncbi:hypothetical protein [Nitrospira sp. BLG_1]|uniref:hypothetical protein n=1 Tax=Nitrospira sp. BLG_1 TaxID=3395883 RepID=UPI0039BD2F05
MLPVLLAGPILRRAEPTLVTAWMAFSEEVTVRINIWDALVHDAGPSALLSTDLQPLNPRSNSASSIRIGDKLHLAQAIFKVEPEKALFPGRPYSYNVLVRDRAGNDHDLKSLGLLSNGEINGHSNLAMGYEPGFLPTFMLPPAELTDLRILHGSCRRMTQEMEDGMAWVDDLIREARLADPIHRPHQLCLTGDQIYADDVALPFLPQLIMRGRELLGNNEFLPTRWPGPDTRYWPADAKHFPPALRREVVLSEGRFTTIDYHSHLLSFGEFAAMYLLVWSNVLWDKSALSSFDEIVERFFASGPPWDHLGIHFQQRDASDQPKIERPLLEKFLDLVLPSGSGPNTLTVGELRATLKPRDIDAEPTWRFALEARLLLPDRRQRILDQVNADLDADTKVTPANDQEREWLKDKHEGHTKIFRIVDGLPQEEQPAFQAFYEALQSNWGGLYDTKHSVRKREVDLFYNNLPKVRRALANVPVYMMADDHEVTDDWNLNPIWKDRVYTNPLGKTVLRNGILAYALFQGWGNDPDYFQSGPAAELLTRAQELFPTGATAPSRESEAAERINVLLGLDGAERPPVRWHYSVSCARHLLLALDNRTRRSFVSRIGPPGNIAISAIAEQVPEGPLPAGLEVLIVMAPLPIVGPPVFDEVVAPLSYRVFDMISYVSHRNNQIKGMPGTNPDAIEAWAFDPKTMEAVLKRLEPYRRIVLLSGDVHNGSTQFLSYWKKGDTQPARFVQFTSSGVRNVMPNFLRVVDRGFAFVQRIIRANIGITRLGWNQKDPAPLSLPPGNEGVMPVLAGKLASSPVLIPAGGWPATASFARPPDWSWRAHVVLDERPDSARPEAARPAPLPSTMNATSLDGYRQLVARHVKQFKKASHGRQVLMANNLGRIHFEQLPQAIHAVQELFTVHPAAPDPKKAEVYALHRVQLAALAGATIDEPEPTLGDAG